jgi:hypothetical protein
MIVRGYGLTTWSRLGYRKSPRYPLPADRRSAFLIDIATELSGLPEIGDGALHRVIMITQRRYFAPPILEGHNIGGRPHAGKCA